VPDAFDFSLPPFDRLSDSEQRRLRKALDIGFFRSGETVLAAGAPAESFFVLIKGFVEERDREDVVAVYGPGDMFDSRRLIGAPAGNAFIVAEEALCYLIPTDLLLAIIRENPGFATYFHQSIAQKVDALAGRRDSQELQSLMTARVRQAFIHPPEFIAATSPAYEAVALMKARRLNALLVRSGREAGIVTALSLSDAVILRGQPTESPVGPIATWELVDIQANDFLFNALVLMTRHNLRRLVVRDGREIVGLLEEVDVLSFLSNHSHIVALQVARAETREDLKTASRNMVRLVEVLHGTGVRIPFIAETVSELAGRILARLFGLIAGEDFARNACLIVMGSEGRREQILKTDQDNGLILRAPVDPARLERVTTEFRNALLEFGYPPCPGDIMVTNPDWARTLDDYRADFRHWSASADGAAVMKAAIFADATAVAGDPGLLAEARTALFDSLAGNDAFLYRFAQAADAFDVPRGPLARLIAGRAESQALDIKKSGLFPIVHGVRSLALQRRLVETNTIDRIRRLQDTPIFDRPFAEDLVQSFTVFQELRLKTRLGRGTAAGGPDDAMADTVIDPQRLGSLEREVLKDSLAVVKRFRELVRHHFRLAAI
jgi:CBS domain-containing protein